MATETTEAGGSDGSGSPGAGARLRSLAGSVLERREGSVLVGLIAIFFVGVYIDASRFLLLDNMARILRSAATTAIIGYGVALLMVTAEFDQRKRHQEGGDWGVRFGFSVTELCKSFWRLRCRVWVFDVPVSEDCLHLSFRPPRDEWRISAFGIREGRYLEIVAAPAARWPVSVATT